MIDAVCTFGGWRLGIVCVYAEIESEGGAEDPEVQVEWRFVAGCAIGSASIFLLTVIYWYVLIAHHA